MTLAAPQTDPLETTTARRSPRMPRPVSIDAVDWGTLITGVVGIAGVAGVVVTSERARGASLKIHQGSLDAEKQRAAQADKRRTYAIYLAKLKANVAILNHVGIPADLWASAQELMVASDEVGLIGNEGVALLADRATSLAVAASSNFGCQEEDPEYDHFVSCLSTLHSYQFDLISAMRADLNGAPIPVESLNLLKLPWDEHS